MKENVNHYYLCVMFLSFVSLSIAESLSLKWSKEYSAVSTEGLSTGCIVYDSSEKNIWLTGTSFQKDNNHEGRMWIRQYDLDGNEISDLIVEMDPNVSVPYSVADKIFTDVILSPTGNFWISGAIGKLEEMRKANISHENKQQTFSNMVLQDNKKLPTKISKKKLFYDNSLLVVGNEGQKGTISKITEDGNVVWDKQIAFDDYTVLCDGLVIGDKGNSIVVGVSTKTKDIYPLPQNSKVFLLSLDALGNVIKEKKFVGEALSPLRAQLCEGDSDNFILCYDTNPELQEVDIVCSLYTSDLVEKKQISINNRNLRSFGKVYVSSVPNSKGQFVVIISSYTQGFELFQYDNIGREIGYYLSDRKGVATGVVCAESMTFVAVSGISKGEKINLSCIKLNQQ